MINPPKKDESQISAYGNPSRFRFLAGGSKSQKHHVRWDDAIFLRQDCALKPKDLLNAAFKQSDDFFHLMDFVLLMENQKKLSASNFSQLIGCIEDFDNKINKSGSSQDVTRARKSLLEVVKKHGTPEDLKTFKDLANAQPNRLSLAERLKRLQQDWANSGFRGSLEISDIIRIRNDVSHGRSVDLSSDDARVISRSTGSLCALTRFHIFRELGIQDEEIARAFRRAGRYGKYAPQVLQD